MDSDRKKVAVNGCGLHSGGGIQVFVSFFRELQSLDISDLDIDFFVSSEIDKNLRDIESDIHCVGRYVVYNTYGLSAFWSKINVVFDAYDIVFTVFGPSYLRVSGRKQLVGFAQRWIVDNSAYHLLPLHSKLFAFLKYGAQKKFFSRARKLIVEIDSVRTAVIGKRIAKADSVYVVRNCVSSIFSDRKKWGAVSIEASMGCFSVGCIGRDYPHKNLAVLPHVKDILSDLYQLEVDFYVTLKDEEWDRYGVYFKDRVINVGELSVSQCPNFYQRMDAIIFPSVLECFSSVCLETLMMCRPLFASDRDFVRDVCGEYAYYFDPLDVSTVAAVIASYVREEFGRDSERRVAAREYATGFSNARGRAEGYVNILRGFE